MSFLNLALTGVMLRNEKDRQLLGGNDGVIAAKALGRLSYNCLKSEYLRMTNQLSLDTSRLTCKARQVVF